jgi:hypothetical protein
MAAISNKVIRTSTTISLVATTTARPRAISGRTVMSAEEPENDHETDRPPDKIHRTLLEWGRCNQRAKWSSTNARSEIRVSNSADREFTGQKIERQILVH